MINHEEMSERKLKILHAIIQNYLETGEPVGSRTISKYTDLNLSSATIRNEMADLEEMGYIIQPHTSAGRIPSDKGYRLYVDMLMEEKEQELNEMQDQMLDKADKMDQLLKQAKRILRLNMGMIESLSTAIEFRSGESGEHIRKIHDITKLFLENSPLGRDFSTEEIEHISLAAIMHDVGKISIPDAILSKPGRLTPEEFEIMKKPGRGTHGHIAILTNNVDRAIYHLSQRGVKFDMDSKNVKDGKTIAIYFADEVAGFAIHLVQK